MIKKWKDLKKIIFVPIFALTIFVGLGFKAVLAKQIGPNVPGFWRQVKSLGVGNLLWGEGGWSEIKNIKFISGAVKVYNLTVGAPHDFFANGILAHNKAQVLWVRIVDESNTAWGYHPDPDSANVWYPASKYSSDIRVVANGDESGADLFGWDARGFKTLEDGFSNESWSQGGAPLNPANIPDETFRDPLAAQDPKGNIEAYAGLSGAVPGSSVVPVVVTPPAGYYCSSIEAWAGGDASWHQGPLYSTCTVNVPGSSGGQFVVARIAPCATPSIASVTNQNSCLIGNTSKTWAVNFSGYNSACGGFNLQVNRSWVGGAVDDTVSVAASSYNYTATIPNSDSAADAHSICFRVEYNGQYSAWSCDYFGTDISAPICGFIIREPAASACGGAVVTETDSDLVDLQYRGSNNGCSPVSRMAYALDTADLSFSAYSSCKQDFDIGPSGPTNPYSIYARYRDSLGRNSLTCSREIEHPIMYPQTVTIDVWDDQDNDSSKDGGEGPLSTARISSLYRRKQNADGTWPATWTSLGKVNSYSSVWDPGTYQVRIDFTSACPNYATGTGVILNGVSGGYSGTSPFRKTFAVDYNPVNLSLGGWEPLAYKGVRGVVYEDPDCLYGGPTSYYTNSFDATGDSSLGGQTFTDSGVTGGGYNLGDGASVYSVSYCSPDTVSVTFSPWAQGYRLVEGSATPPLSVSIDYGSPDTVPARNVYVCYDPPSWMQVEGSDIIAKAVKNMEVPSGEYLASDIPFTVTSDLSCSPGSASQNYGSGIKSYGAYNLGGSDPWPFAWNFGDSTSNFSDLSGGNYIGLQSGTWYRDTSGHFESIGSYRVDNPCSGPTNGEGVAYVVVSGDATLSGDFVKDDASALEGLVVFIDGDLTIAESVASNVASPGFNLDAIFVVNGNVSVEGGETLPINNGQLRIRGGLYISQTAGGNLFVGRALEKDERENYPIVYIEYDPVYWLYGSHSELSKTPLSWTEI